MSYRLIITDRAEELLDDLVNYLLYKIKNQQAAIHLLDNIERLYDRLAENPMQFPFSMDTHLLHRGYREAVLPDMNYVLIFKIEGSNVYVLGVFHQLEQYRKKV